MRIPTTVARRLVEQPHEYPLWLVEHAERSLTVDTEPPMSVGELAKRDRWFG
jgi:hypothetical protein